MSQFWKQFFEASANVSLSGYEENANEEDLTHTDTTTTNLDITPDQPQSSQGGAQKQREIGEEEEEEEEFSVDSPTQVTGLQTTPRLPSTSKKATTNGRAQAAAAFRSPSPRKYTGKNPRALDADTSDEPSTPRPAGMHAQSSPFEPESAFQPSAAKGFPRTANDPLMHRVLDKTYRVQATPHTARRARQRQQQQESHPSAAAGEAQPSPAKQSRPWDDSPQSSPAIAAPQLRSELFSPAKRNAINAPRTPGVSILTPARSKALTVTTDVPTTSTGRVLFSPQDKAHTQAQSQIRTRNSNIFSSPSDPYENNDDNSEDDIPDISPPKTMQFHIPTSRLLQTPAREASKRIVEDLLLTAGADVTDEIEGVDDESLVAEPGPSVVRNRGWLEESLEDF